MPSSMPSSTRGPEHLPDRHGSTARFNSGSWNCSIWSLAAKASNIWAFAMLGSDEAPEECHGRKTTHLLLDLFGPMAHNVLRPADLKTFLRQSKPQVHFLHDWCILY